MNSPVLVVLTNCPDAAVAARITSALLENGLAACVNQLAAVTSTYRWQGKVQTQVEIPLWIKTTAARYSEVEAAIRSAHPYEVPEIIAVPLAAGFAPYLRWVADETQPPQWA